MDKPSRASPVPISVTAEAPLDLLQAGLVRLLALARQGAGAPATAGTAAIPVRGLARGLDQLFVALAAELIAQVEEFGPGLDEIRLDGLLRTDAGGYTAWGYLTGGIEERAQGPLDLEVIAATVEPVAGELRLTFAVQSGPS